MKSRKWHGAVLYLAIMGATSSVIGLRTFHTATTANPSVAVSTSSPSRPGTAPRSTTTGKKPSTAPTKPAAPKVVTLVGATSQTDYGPVQVSVTFKGKQITDVKVLQTPTQDGRSQSIAARAVPTLHDEVISSQSANINTVSGATYTSEGYAQSVQSAIDHLGG